MTPTELEGCPSVLYQWEYSGHVCLPWNYRSIELCSCDYEVEGLAKGPLGHHYHLPETEG